MKIRILWLHLLLLALPFGAGACQTADPVDAEDSFVVFPTAEVSWQIRPAGGRRLGSPEAEEWEADVGVPKRAFSLALDLDLAFGRASTDQDLDASDRVNLDSTDFLGPGKLDVDYDIYLWTFAARIGGWAGEVVAFEGIAGLSLTDLEMKLSMGPLDESDTDVNFGPVVGGRITFRAVDWFDIFLQLRASSFWGGGTAGTYSDTRLGIVAEPVPGLGFTAGWRFIVYRSDRVADSDYRLDLGGPTLGVRLRF